MKEKVEIEKVYSRRKNGIVPTLLKFQNGRLAAFTKDNTQFCRLRHREDRNQKAALVTTNGQAYHGWVNNTAADELTDTYVCVRNKATNKMVVIPIDQVCLKNNVYNELDKKETTAMTEESTSQELMIKFGNRKALRYIKDREQMHMTMDVVQPDLENAVNESTLVEDEANDKEDKDVFKYLDDIRPPYNANANTLSEVYKMTDVISAELLERLDEEAKTIYQTKIEKLPIKSQYLLKKIAQIQAAAPSAEGFLHIKAIIYMDCLLNLITSRVRSLNKAELSGISEKVENNVRDRFADPNGNYSGSRTTFSTEKALCYFIVLALLISGDYSVDATILSEELKAPRAKVVKYSQIVYATRRPKTTVISLRLPSTVPDMQIKFPRRKK